jgi:hypothetical protein
MRRGVRINGMETVTLSAVVAEDGSLRPVQGQHGLPVGEEVEVTLRRRTKPSVHPALLPSPLDGTLLKYEDPDEPVGLEDWEMLPDAS